MTSSGKYLLQNVLLDGKINFTNVQFHLKNYIMFNAVRIRYVFAASSNISSMSKFYENN